MKKIIYVDSLPIEDGYLIDTVVLRRKVRIYLSAEELKQAEDKLNEYESRPLKMAFAYGVLAKRDCGHWELFQTHKIESDEVMEEMYCNGRCTRCICGFNK